MATQAEIQAKINEIISNGNYPANKMRPLLTDILAFIIESGSVNITRVALQLLIQNAQVVFNRDYYITDAVGSTTLIKVFGATINTIADNALNLTTGTFGEYNILADTFTIQP